MELSFLRGERFISLGLQGEKVLRFDLEDELRFKEIRLPHQFEHFRFLEENKIIVAGTYHRPTTLYWF